MIFLLKVNSSVSVKEDCEATVKPLLIKDGNIVNKKGYRIWEEITQILWIYYNFC